METVVKRLYESMFLVDSGQAASDWQGVNDAIEKILTRGGAEIVSLKKWDERKLAYDINGKARGTYILVYFNSDPTCISQIERDVQLSEQLMRVMVLRTDRMSTEDIERPTPVMKVEIAAAEAVKAAEAREAAKVAKAAEAAEAAEAEAAKAVEVEAEPEAVVVDEAPAEEAEADEAPAEAAEAVADEPSEESEESSEDTEKTEE